MVAFVSGNGLGLGNSSLDVLGAQGAVGDGKLGRACDKVFVNVATGNLVVQRQDDFLSVLGQDVSVGRTYNSRGLADGDNNDGWRLGVVKVVSGLTGTLNTAGSTITRTDGDGATTVYTWNATLGAYASTSGAGAFDTLRFTPAGPIPASWTWTDGATQQTETYDWGSYTYSGASTNIGKIIATADTHGNKVTYDYQAYAPAAANSPAYANNFLVKTLTAGNGDRVDFAWNQANLASVTTTAGGVARQSVSYTYDANNRLLAVNVAAAASGQWTDPVNVTTFEYNVDGTISSITGDDASLTTFTYAGGKIATVSQLVDGAARSVSLTYVSDTQTTITDADGNTTLGFDASGSERRLTSVRLPAGELFQYAYDTDGNLTQVTDARGLATTYGYDTRGNQLWSMDAAGNTIKRTFSAKNELLSESLYVVPDADALGTPDASTPLSTQYAYDAESHRRFVVSAQRSVTEYRYDSLGRRALEIVYAAAPYSGSFFDESSLATWAGAQNMATAQQTQYGYDTRGNLMQVMRNPAPGTGGTAEATQYMYGSNGLPLATTSANGTSTAYTYDSLGRVASSTNPDGVTTYLYDDTNNRVTVTRTDSSRVISVYNAAGELVSMSTVGAQGTTATESFAYDAKGRLRMKTDATGLRSYVLYDSDGRKAADIDASGSLVEYAYNANGQLSTTTRYATALTATQLASLVDANGRPTSATLASIRPAASAADGKSWNLYDRAGRLAKTVSETGLVTQMQYDGASRVVAKTRFATAVAVSVITATTSPADAAVSLATSANDETTRLFYDDDGRLLATLDAMGALVENLYDGAGRLWKTVQYFTSTATAYRAAGTLAQLRPVADTAGRDITTFYFHDGEGRICGVLDGERLFTATAYDRDGNLLETRRYAAASTVDPATITSTTSASAVTPSGSVAITRHIYDAMGRETQRVDVDGATTTFTYDRLGRLITTRLNAGTPVEQSTQLVLDDLGRVMTEMGSASGPVSYQYDLEGRRLWERDALGQRTLFYYDADGRLAYTINPLGEVVADTYNSLNQLAQTRRYANRIPQSSLSSMNGGWAASVAGLIAPLANDAIDRRIAYTYTLDGRIAVTTDEKNVTTTAAYSALGTTQYKADENGNVTRYVYDANERLVYEVDATNGVVGYTYDNFGRVVTTTRYAQAVSTATIAPNAKAPIALSALASAVALIADATRDQASTNVYDRDGRAVFTVSAAGAVEARTFDAFGNVIAQVNYARTITLPATMTATAVAQACASIANPATDEATWSSYDAAGRLTYRADATGAVTTFTYDAGGQLAERVSYGNKTTTPSARTLPPPDIAHESRVRMFYDAAGRLVKTATASTMQGTALMWAIVANTYDPAGNRVATTEYATLQADPQASPVGSAADRISRNVYDGAGQVAFTIDAEGSVTQFTRDSAGRVTQTRVYATTWTQTGNPSVGAMSMIAMTPQDRVHRTVYDSAGRAAYVIDSFGAVTQSTYDAAGHVTQTRRYARPVNVSGIVDITQMGWICSPDPADRVTRTVYDAAGRPTWTIDAQGAVVGSTYDAQGRLIAKREYAQTISIASLPVGTAPNMMTLADAVNDRFTQYAYDAEGRLACQVDAGGYITQTTYNAQDRVTSTTLNAIPVAVTAGVVATRNSIDSWASTHPSTANQTTSTVYDAGGRALRVTDANGATETYNYDGRGLRITFTDKRGYAWKSAYNAAGLLVKESTPALDIAQVSTGASGEPVIGGQPSQTIDTVTGYNAFGEVSWRIEANGTPQARTTGYQYDRVGHQVRTTFPQLQVLTDVSGSTLLTSTATPETVVTYDALGNALRNTAANGSRSYRVHDAEGRLAFEIDGLGYVTGYARNTFGEVTALTRYAATRTVTAGTLPTLADMQAFATSGTHTDDRTIKTTYDANGRVVLVLEPIAHVFDPATSTHVDAGKATASAYNAFGEVLRRSVYGQLANGVAVGTTANTYFGWNVRGLQAIRIDVASRTPGTDKGYLTTMAYDAAGRVVDRIEYSTQQDFWDASFNLRTGMSAPPPVAKADDRRVQSTYDRNGNLLTETHVNVTFSTASDGSQTTGNLTTTNTYDAAGNLLSTTDASGATTFISYDVAGRKTAVATYSIDAKKRQVAQIYLALLGRAPTTAEVSDGITRAPLEIAQAIVATANGKTADQFLADLFAGLVARAPDAGASAAYLPEITASNRAQFALNMITRFGEAMNQDTAIMGARTGAAVAGTSLATATDTERRRLMIASMYVVVLGRPPEAGGMSFALTGTQTDVQLANAMFASPEGLALFPPETTAWEVAARIYQATHGVPADNATLSALAAQATADRANWGSMGAQQVNSVLQGPSGPALAYLSNKIMSGLPEGADVYATPGSLVKFLLDAYGNVVQKIEYAAGVLDGIDVFQQTAGVDRTTYTQYDTSGHAIRQWDAQDQATTIAYDIDGHAAADLRVGTSTGGATQAVYDISRYDVLGRLVETDRPGSTAADARVASTIEYNAFGEVARRRTNGTEVEYFDYDNAGHLWRTNTGDGVDKVYLYDAFGHRTAQILDVNTSLRSVASVSAVVTGDQLIETDFTYDLQGNVVSQKSPTQYAGDIGTNGATTSATPVVTTQAMSVGFSVTSSVYQVDQSTGGDGGGTTKVWTGINTVHVSWASLAGLGAGDIRLEVSYLDAADAWNKEVREFGADSALAGQDVSWTAGLPVKTIQRVQVFKKSISGDWQPIIDASAPGQTASLLRIHAAADPNVVTRLQYRVVGTTAWTDAAALGRFGDTCLFDTSVLAEGTYEYQVFDASAAQPRDSGTFGAANPGLREKIARLYATLLNRAADASGMGYHLTRNTAPADVAAALLQSTEQNLAGRSAQDVIRFILANAFNRPVPALGGDLEARASTWTSRLAAATTVAQKGAVLLALTDEVTGYTGTDAEMIAVRDLLARKTSASRIYAIDYGGSALTEARAMMAQLNVSSDLNSALALGADSARRRMATSLYVAILNRAPDAAGLAYQVTALRNGATVDQLADSLYNSAEAKASRLYWNADGTPVTDTQLVTNVMQIMGRTAMPWDIAFWTNYFQVNGRAKGFANITGAIATYSGSDPTVFTATQVFNNKTSIGLSYAYNVGGSQSGAEQGLIAYATGNSSALGAAQDAVSSLNAVASAAQSAETTSGLVANSSPMEEYRRKIAELYAIILDRAPDAAGMTKYYEDLEFRGLSTEDTANALLASAEGSPKYAGMTNDQFASAIVTKVFARTPTAAEVTYWSQTLAGWSRGGMVCRMLERIVAEADVSTSSARQLLANKGAVGVMWSVDLGGGNGDLATCQQLMTLTTATDTTAAINAAVTAITNTAQADANAAYNASQPASSKAGTAYTATNAIANSLAAQEATNAIVPTVQSEQFTQLAQMYLGILNRTAQYTELDWHFSNEFQVGLTQVQIADSFFQSGEGVTLYGGLTNAQVVTKIYQFVLNRAPDSAGLTTWTNALNAGQSRGKVFVDIVNGFLGYSGTDTTEYSNKALFQQKVSNLLGAARGAAAAALYTPTKLATLTLSANKEAADFTCYNADTQRVVTMLADSAVLGGDALTYTKLEQLYLGGLNRAGSLNELIYYTKQLATSTLFRSLDDVAQAFVNSSEGAALYGGTTNDAFIDKVYRQAFGRAVDTAGLTTWRAQFSAGRTRGQVMRGIIDSLANYASAGTNAAEMARKAAFFLRVRDALASVTTAATNYRNNAYATFVQSASDLGRQLATSVDSAEVGAMSGSTEARNRNTILQLYTLLFNAAPTLAAMNTWVAQMAAGSTPLQIATAMLATSEGVAKYPATTSISSFVTTIFQSTLGRPPNVTNLNTYSSGTLAQIAVNMAANISGYAGIAPADVELRVILGDKVMLNAAIESARSHDPAAATRAAATEAARVLSPSVAPVDIVRKDGFLASKVSGAQIAGETPMVTRTYDRWGNLKSETDARNATWVTRYSYNALDEITTVTDALNNTTQRYYDAAGHNVATRDARGAINGQVYDVQGHVVEEIHADGGTVQYRFNAFGDKVLQRGGDGQVATYAYDRNGHVTSLSRGGSVMVDTFTTRSGSTAGYVGSWDPADPASTLIRKVVTESYEYDAFGRRIGYTDANGYKSLTYYDLRGNVLQTTDAIGRSTQYSWDAFDRKIRQTFGDGRLEEWSYDAAGRVAGHRDMTGWVTGYTYNTNTGWLLSQQRTVSTGISQNVQYTYDISSGLLLKIEDRSVPGAVQVTQYAYDLGARHTREKTSTVNASGIESDVAQDNHISYDALGREVHVQDGRYDVTWTYDAAGNRLGQRTRYTTRMSDGTDSVVDKTSWNKYDAMNRATVIDGVQAANGDAVISGDAGTSQGQQISYDGAGNRIHVTQWGKGLVTGTVLGVPLTGSFAASSANIRTSETSFYDAAGRLQTMYREGAIADSRRYDAAGNVVETGQLGLDGIDAAKLEAMGISAQTRLSAYDAAGQLAQQAVMNKGWRTNTDRPESTIGYAYDALGRVSAYDTSMHTAGYARHYDYRYTDRDNHSVASIEVHEVVPGVDDDHPVIKPDVLARTVNTYDAGGYLTHVEGTDLKDTRDIVNDAQGRVLRKTQYTRQPSGAFDSTIVAHETNTLIVNGQEIGSSGDDKAVKDTFNSSYVKTGSFTANTFYTVQAGDTLQSIARAFWGDQNLWYLIADANGRSTISTGQVILIPARPSTATNNASTVRPYDPGKAIGDLTPTAPMPQGHHGGCGGLGQVLVVVVAIAASAFLGPEMMAMAQGFVGGAGLGATVLGGAMTGAAVSAVSQLAGMALGVQHGFSLKGVALGAIGGGVTAGLSGVDLTGSGVLNSTGNLIARAAVANVMTQGIGVVTGAQHSFSWKGVAAASVGAGVGQAVGGELGLNGPDAAGSLSAPQLFGARLLTGVVAGAATAAMRGGRITAQQVAIDAFGNAIGSSLADASRPSTQSMGAGAEQMLESSGQGLKLTADQVASFGPHIGPTWNLNSGSGIRLNASDVIYRTDDEVPTYVDPDTGAVSSPVREPYIVTRPLPPLPPLANGSDARASANEYWGQIQDEGAAQGSFAKYAFGGAMRTFAGVGHDLWDAVTGAQDDPLSLANGGRKGIANFGPELFNGGANLLKTSLNGYALLAEKLGVGDGALAGFRESSPYNITPLYSYDNKTEAAGALLANFAMTGAAAKYGAYAIEFDAAGGTTFANSLGVKLVSPRYQPGVVTYGDDLMPASGRWLDAGTPTPIPLQVAKQLEGRSFQTFDDLRGAIWKTIGNDPELNSGFGLRSIQQMEESGYAPFAPRAYQDPAFGLRFNLHHVEPIGSGGAVYDLSNIRIVSPKVHYGLHY